MECPKCGAETDKNALVCPNCKKVLKIICPECKTINTKSICKKCGKILITKCAKCGKINLMKNSKCVKCGYSNEISAIVLESNTDNFAVVRIDFPNSDVVKATLGSNQLFTKFRAHLDAVINGYLTSIDVRRQIINDDIYILRFNKHYTFSASANAAIAAVTELAKIITKLNVKLNKKKGVTLKCNFSIMKRSSEQNPYDIDTKFRANMIHNSGNTRLKVLDSFEVFTDENLYDLYKDRYKTESLSSIYVDGVMKRFYGIDINEFINIEEMLSGEIEAEDLSENAEVPAFIAEALKEQKQLGIQTLSNELSSGEEDTYDIETVKYDEIKCIFAKTLSIDAEESIMKILAEVPKGILSVKASSVYKPYTRSLLAAVESTGIYENVISLTCHDYMKYTPYAFFRDLVGAIFEYTISQKFRDSNDFSMFSKVDGSGLIKDLVNLNPRPMQDMYMTREGYFNVFAELLQAVPNHVIYVENFENIDDGSMSVLEQLFDKFEEFNIACILSYGKEFALHRKCHFLLSRPYYTEVTLLPTPGEVILKTDAEYYKNVLNDFHFGRILEYSCGSTLFIDFAVQYLVESGVYKYLDNSVCKVSSKTIIIPSSLEKLTERRLNIMKDNREVMRFLTSIVLLGTRIDPVTLKSLGFADYQKICDELIDKGYICSFNGCIYFSNYDLIKKSVLKVVGKDELRDIAENLLEKVYEESMPEPAKTYLYAITGRYNEEVFEWEKLANVSLSAGDFFAYSACSSEILRALNEYRANWSDSDFEQYKNSLFENVSANTVDYNPEKYSDLAEQTLEYLKKNGSREALTGFCSVMIRGAVFYNDYRHAKDLTHFLFSALEGSSIDPGANNFNPHLLLWSVLYVKILFNTGSFSTCIDIGYNILSIWDAKKIETVDFGGLISKDEFRYLLTEMCAYIAISIIITLKDDVREFLNTASKLLPFLPQSYNIFVQLQSLVRGEAVTVEPPAEDADLFVAVCCHIIKAFSEFKNEPKAFAEEMYKCKLIAKDTMMYQFELFADLMIAYSYINLSSNKKAGMMCEKIIKIAEEKGLFAIEHSGRYVLGVLNLREGNIEVAYNMLYNSGVAIEKAGGISDYLTVFNKLALYKVLLQQDLKDRAEVCLKQAMLLIKKYGLNFKINVDMK